MSEGIHEHQPMGRETAAERAEFADMEAERYPPFDRTQFILFLGFGLLSLSFGTWSLVTYDRVHRFPSIIPYVANTVGVGFMFFAFLGRHLQKLEDRKAILKRPHEKVE